MEIKLNFREQEKDTVVKPLSDLNEMNVIHSLVCMWSMWKRMLELINSVLSFFVPYSHTNRIHMLYECTLEEFQKLSNETCELLEFYGILLEWK